MISLLKYLSVLLVAFMLPAAALVAQKHEGGTGNPLPGYGGFAHLNINLHTASFTRLPGVPNCCKEFTSGSGTGITAGLFYQYPLSRVFSLSLRGAYSTLGATLREQEGTTVIVQGETVPGQFEHVLESSLATIGIEPLAGYSPAKSFTLYAGPSVGFFIQQEFSQQEDLVEPATTGVFENGKRVRNDTTGMLPDGTALHAALLFGVGYEVPLNKAGTLTASPELFFSLGITPLVDGLTWSAHALRLGVAVKYSPAPLYAPPATPIAVTETPPVPPQPAQPVLAATLTAVGVTNEGVEQPKVKLQVEEFVSTHMRPLLNYVFFAENSSEIPARYNRLTGSETSVFEVRNLHNTPTLPTYYHLLNIIGRRMQERPDATISLIGCNSNTGPEKGNIALSQQRVENVQRYLQDVWGIDAARITSSARGLPEKPSNVTQEDGIQENRRVEIYSDTWEILEPVLTNDTLRTVNLQAIRFKPNVSATAGSGDWLIDASQQGETLKEFSGTGTPPAQLDWDIANDQGKMPMADAPVTYDMVATDTEGRTVRTPQAEIPVEVLTIQKKRRERIADKEIDRYSLILFDFDKSELTVANKRIADFITKNIRPNATVTITGFTDRMGDGEYNLRLSRERAQATGAVLNATAASSVSGLGESQELYDNNLPEGRFYSRTVNVVVETPVGQ